MARQGDRRKLAEWRQRLQRFEKSGLTVAGFCARERVSVPTFWY
ncbi:MAG: IS66 family insertion sequence element accessory protein TnpA, partial [Planctomycetia bacterium]